MSWGRALVFYIIKVNFKVYQWVISPAVHFLAGPGSGCRFYPTCSEYSLRAIERHGIRKGSAMTLGRLSRCHPFVWLGGGSGWDPVEGVLGEVSGKKISGNTISNSFKGV